MNNQTTPADEISSTSQSFPLPNRGQPRVMVPGKRPPALAFSLDEDAPTANPPPPDIEKPIHVLPVEQVKRSQTTILSDAERNADLVSVELPSQFFFYPFKDISVGSIRIKHQAKFARAAKEESTLITCETVSSLLGDGISALDLTIPDFFWILYWLRLNNFAKNPLTHKAVCSNPAHVLAVRNGEKPADSLVTIDIVNKSSIKETKLDVEKLQKFLDEADVSELTAGGFCLSAPTMRDTVELEDKWLGRDGFDEKEFLADMASCIRRLDGTLPHASLEERMEFIGELSPDSAEVLSTFREIVQSYGVEEKIATRCKGCNAVVETEISITAFDFL